jgi:hypothetical protein
VWDVEVEQLAQHRRVLIAARFGGELTHPDGRRMQQLLDDPMQRTGNIRPLLLGEFRSPCIELAHLGRDDVFGPGAQGGHGRRDVGAAQPAEEVLDLAGDDLLDGGGLGSARREAARLSMSITVTPLRPVTSGATSRGTARSSTTSGPAPASRSRVSTGSAEAVAEITRAASRRAASRSSKGTATAPYASASRSARAALRLVIRTGPTPARVSVATESAPIAPAPITSAGRPSRSPSWAAATSSAAVTTLWPALSMPVSACARLPTRSACCISSCSSRPAVSASVAAWYASRNCPRICASPTTIESSPADTRNECSTAASS